MNTPNPPTTCLFPGCSNPAHCRGLCATHYQATRRLVKRHKVTWEKLEANGKCAARSVKQTKSAHWCLFPGCSNPAYCRELCATHYQAAHRLVKGHKVTWEKLEANGKCAAQSVKQTKSAHWFLSDNTAKES